MDGHDAFQRCGPGLELGESGPQFILFEPVHDAQQAFRALRVARTGPVLKIDLAIDETRADRGRAGLGCPSPLAHQAQQGQRTQKTMRAARVHSIWDERSPRRLHGFCPASARGEAMPAALRDGAVVWGLKLTAWISPAKDLNEALHRSAPVVTDHDFHLVLCSLDLQSDKPESRYVLGRTVDYLVAGRPSPLAKRCEASELSELLR